MNTTAAALAAVKYGKVMTGPDKLTIRLSLDPKNRNVVFSCRPEEHLGNYKNREVVFDSSFKCTIWFTNPSFFTDKHLRTVEDVTTVSSLSLEPNQPESLFAAVSAGDTELDVKATIGGQDISTQGVRMPPILHIP